MVPIYEQIRARLEPRVVKIASSWKAPYEPVPERSIADELGHVGVKGLPVACVVTEVLEPVVCDLYQQLHEDYAFATDPRAQLRWQGKFADVTAALRRRLLTGQKHLRAVVWIGELHALAVRLRHLTVAIPRGFPQAEVSSDFRALCGALAPGFKAFGLALHLGSQPPARSARCDVGALVETGETFLREAGAPSPGERLWGAITHSLAFRDPHNIEFVPMRPRPRAAPAK